VTPELNALAHHASERLCRFGTLGAFEKNVLEAWHDFFKCAEARFTADSFFGAHKRLVEEAVQQRQPGAASILPNVQRRKAPSKARARMATRAADCRLRGKKKADRSTVGGESRADE